MRDALNATGRPILYSLCNWGVGQPHLWGQQTGNSWRTGRDVFAVWDEHTARDVLKLPGYLQSVMTAIEDLASYHRFAGPGGFNDPDMLVVGLDGMTPYGIIDSDDKCPPHLAKGQCKKGDYISRELWGKVGGLTYTEQRTHFAFWCILSSPLMLGNDPRHMSAATKRLLTAPGMLAINQDPLGQQAERIYKEGDVAIWRKELASGDHAFLLFNGGSTPTDITTRWERDLPELWAANRKPVKREPPCTDNAEVADTCAGWAKGGECAKNPGYMRGACPLSCDACPPAKWEGEQATAHVMNAWEQEHEGEFIAMYTAMHVEPHEARVILVGFGPQAPAFMLGPSERSAAATKSSAAAEAMDAPIARGSERKSTSRDGVLLLLPQEEHAVRAEAAGAAATMTEAVVTEGDSSRPLRSHRHSVHEQHFHEIGPPTLGACAHQYGPSLLLMYVASLTLAGVIAYIIRFVMRARVAQQKQRLIKRAAATPP